MEELTKNLKKEIKQRQYFEDLYKEEREKNLDLQKQIPTVSISLFKKLEN